MSNLEIKGTMTTK